MYSVLPTAFLDKPNTSNYNIEILHLSKANSKPFGLCHQNCWLILCHILRTLKLQNMYYFFYSHSPI
jgi:hypothetical protein